ncbi:beta-1,3-glucanase family protein [Dactylosporangium aurantiacum]|uniref:beta-1,3-glucanase family protein n=1 Tax=Dactylosporangium aurantiacum TaxID=35754 RepID=UPI000526A4BC|nr:beta-1,3-glucanase family protein [Dactylosporangium aurantiacum]MDG6100864.1 beta-1,3-glucanase family protein [Dactylosporangium aurantiacum]
MRFRTKVLGALAALAVAVPVGISAMPSASALGPNLLPFTVKNTTGRADAVYLYVLGVNLTTGRLGYVNAGGTFTNWAAGSNPPSPAPDVAIAGPANGASTTIQLPKNLSGRVYMSLGQKLKFFLTPDGLVQPAPWSASDPNHDILFDWSEFTYNDAGLWLNSSQVDMFAVPHEVSVTGGNGVTTRTGAPVANGRQNVINQVKAQPGWGNTVVTRADGTVLRVLAPGKAADAGLFSATYLDPYITNAWNAYTSKTLTVVPFTDQPGVKYFGRTNGTVMTFTNGSGQQVASFNKPSTSNVWGCDGALGAPNDQVVGPIARTLCAALHRGTLGTIDTQPGGGAADFYKSSLTNHYSRIIHANMADGKAYGFAFDDVQNQESLVHSGDPRSAGITLSPFVGGTTPPTTTPTTTAPTTKPPTTQPPAGNVSAIASDWHGKCIDVPNWNFNDGQRLIVWNCTGGTNQRWTWVDGTLRTENNKCMDVAWGSTANGAAIQIANCSGNPAQQFVLSAAGDLVNPQANKCVDIAGWNPNNDAVLHLWECTGGANQKWHRV